MSVRIDAGSWSKLGQTRPRVDRVELTLGMGNPLRKFNSDVCPASIHLAEGHVQGDRRTIGAPYPSIVVVQYTGIYMQRDIPGADLFETDVISFYLATGEGPKIQICEFGGSCPAIDISTV